MDPEPDALEPGRPGGQGLARLRSAELFCENCGRNTPHRILRIERGARPQAGRIRGTARCRDCRWTHPFDSRIPRTIEVGAVVSTGERSEHLRIALPIGRRVQLGTGLSGSPTPVVVRRIEGRDGRSLSSAHPEEIATVWATRDLGAVVKVSLVEGRRTRTGRLVVPPDTPYAVGDRVTVEGERIEIVALRARGRTWRRPGDAFPASEVQRLYGRRTSIPPAGRSDWRSPRGSSSSAASSTSRSARVRSSPGVRRTRTVPRARTAAGGAHVHRSSPS